MFYTSVIQSTFSFCILVYYGNASSRDIHKVHRIIRQAQKLTQCQCQSIQEIYNIVCTRKVRLIVGDEAHPLHQCYSKLRSGIRFTSMRGRTKRYLTSFVPASITHFNSLCRRWKYVGWLELQLCMCIMSYLGYFTYDYWLCLVYICDI